MTKTKFPVYSISISGLLSLQLHGAGKFGFICHCSQY
jgi:hypothetical protein